jgi:hypothetical protein
VLQNTNANKYTGNRNIEKGNRSNIKALRHSLRWLFIGFTV